MRATFLGLDVQQHRVVAVAVADVLEDRDQVVQVVPADTPVWIRTVLDPGCSFCELAQV